MPRHERGVASVFLSAVALGVPSVWGIVVVRTVNAAVSTGTGSGARRHRGYCSTTAQVFKGISAQSPIPLI
jgi:hypothetical protein